MGGFLIKAGMDTLEKQLDPWGSIASRGRSVWPSVNTFLMAIINNNNKKKKKKKKKEEKKRCHTPFPKPMMEFSGSAPGICDGQLAIINYRLSHSHAVWYYLEALCRRLQ